MTDIVLMHHRRDPVVAVIPMTSKGIAFINEHMIGGPCPRITTEAMVEIQKLIIENNLEVEERAP